MLLGVSKMTSTTPFNVAATEEEKKLSFEEKLDLIDHEIQTIYNMCVKSGFTPHEIEKCAGPLLDPVKSVQRRRLMNKALLVGFIVALVFALLYYDHPVHKFITAVIRLASIKVIPLWDWSRYYRDQCLIKNPYYQNQRITEEICENCRNLTAIERLSDVSQGEVSDHFVRGNIPFIVTDALHSWPATGKFSIQFLSELYESNEVLQNDRPCFVKSNIRLKQGQHRTLLKKSTNGKVDNWFMFWDNCDLKATKVFRQFYRRPYFMPNMVEMTGTNWILVTKNMEAKSYKPYFSEDALTWFAQIRGKTEIKLEPAELCDTECHTLHFTVMEGEILVIINDLWFLEFKPVAETESIAIASGGNFDT